MEVKLPFHFSPTISLSTPRKSLKVGQSDPAVRPRFQNGSDAFSTPSSTPETPASWPPRPALTCLGPACLADHSCHLVLREMTEKLFRQSHTFLYWCYSLFEFLKALGSFPKAPGHFLNVRGLALRRGSFYVRPPNIF